ELANWLRPVKGWALRILGTKVLASNHQNNQIAHPHELSIPSLYRLADTFRAAGASCSEALTGLNGRVPIGMPSPKNAVSSSHSHSRSPLSTRPDGRFGLLAGQRRPGPLAAPPDERVWRAHPNLAIQRISAC